MKLGIKQALYLEMESFYLITTEDEGEDLRTIRSLMGGLVRKARKVIPAEADVKEKIHQLLQLMYGNWGFACDPQEYFHTENLYLSYVLRSHRGMPVSLGCILLYLADKLDLPLYPVMFPTQLILRADVADQVAFIDPWDGKYLSQQDLQKLYEGAFGFGATIAQEDLAVADDDALRERFAQLAKGCLIREEHNDAALKYINSRLDRYAYRRLVQPHLEAQKFEPYERRDRGLVLAQMGAYHAAVEDLQYFIEQCPEDPTAFMLMAQLPDIKKELHNDLLH
ncbi:SirB1 family protein [Lonepinella sp. BR2474]|uniref:SirB1 family protein n=1 Tax=Lonepinella sp. BR2474 TaxID=3434548 RepID=UPI003F6DFFAB